MSDNLNYTVCWQALLLVLSVLTVPSTAQQDAGNISLIEGSVELVGGEINGTGNIIIYHLGAWGIVCDDGWNLAGAHVVCRSLGYPAALGHTTQAYFGAVEQTQNVILDDVQCHGDEGGLLDCQHSEWGVHDCDPREAAGVFCAPRDANAVPGHGTYAPTPSPVSVTPPASPTSSPSPSRRPDDAGNVLLMKKALKLQKEAHQRHKHVHNPEPYDIRLVNGRNSNEGRVEVNIDGKWGVICSDHWSLLEATVVCQQKGLGYANMAVQTNSFGGESLDKLISGLHCDGEEDHLAECYHEHVSDDVICSAVTMVAGVVCSPVLPDLVPNATLLLHSSYLEDRPMVYMQCAMEEGCASASAYTIKEKQYDWQMTRRRLLRFSSSTWNFGTAEFRPYLPKNHWEWHDCHMHYHSMSVFAHYDILDEHGNRVAEGHKASFCLEDVQCLPGRNKKFQCKGFADQGISVGCADDYLHDIDCQWVDITDVKPGEYTFRVSINPELRVAELSYSNNAATCHMTYTGFQVYMTNCSLGNLVHQTP